MTPKEFKENILLTNTREKWCVDKFFISPPQLKIHASRKTRKWGYPNGQVEASNWSLEWFQSPKSLKYWNGLLRRSRIYFLFLLCVNTKVLFEIIFYNTWVVRSSMKTISVPSFQKKKKKKYITTLKRLQHTR